MKIGIIGLGNMGCAIYKRLAANNNNSIFVFDKDLKKLDDKKAQILDIKTTEKFDYIILAVKPADIESLRDLKWSGTLISILAGINSAKLKDLFPKNPVIRLMPNTPLLVEEGISGVYFDNGLNQTEKDQALILLNSFTNTVVVEKEDLMNAITALSGSGPAFVYLFIEALADAGVKCGISRNAAYQLAAQTVLGSAKMVLATGKHPGELKDMVTSPAGTTIEGVAALEANGFRHAAIQAITAAYEKAKKLG